MQGYDEVQWPLSDNCHTGIHTLPKWYTPGLYFPETEGSVPKMAAGCPGSKNLSSRSRSPAPIEPPEQVSAHAAPTDTLDERNDNVVLAGVVNVTLGCSEDSKPGGVGEMTFGYEVAVAVLTTIGYTIRKRPKSLRIRVHP